MNRSSDAQAMIALALAYLAVVPAAIFVGCCLSLIGGNEDWDSVGSMLTYSGLAVVALTGLLFLSQWQPQRLKVGGERF